MGKQVLYDGGSYIIEEWTGEQFGEHRFSLDRREAGRLVNIGWYTSANRAMAAKIQEARK